MKASTSENDIEVDAAFGYRIVNLITMLTMLSQILVCKNCGGSVAFSESSKRGLGFKLVVTCEKCGSTTIDSSPLINNHGYDINRRLIFAMRLLGIGIQGINKFCAFMCLPKPVFQKTYDHIVQSIAVATDAVKCKSLRKAAEEEKKICVEKGQLSGLTVSGDSCWRKRGFSSLFGFASLIGWFSGKVIDICVKSKYCLECEYWEEKEDTAEYEEWHALHEKRCHANYSGSAGKMEPDAVVEMFSRSEATHNVRYAYYIGDGDSKTHKSIQDAKPYGDFSVVKKECIGHVQKMLGTRLRNLKNEVKDLGGRGKLTGKLIDDLSIYYGLAIRRNAYSVENMRKEIYAALYHKISTDEKPQHDGCPVGADSWCSWQKAKASHTLEIYTHKPAVPMQVFHAVQKIYEDLTREDLLSRCLGGFTQKNANESLNAVVWSIAPKAISSGESVVDIATNIAVISYNCGFRGLLDVMSTLQL
ncbi:PREDICTED: uncharacterized protein LOC105561015 [Vollenhovia emeryi]|uniref:uncharacterized protein LOC105561015 n=1 Tax=Vollenhovia emeryi TaxID=411798 RepID=UPI0005F386D2|nr:PREDICTED: uncharacterized protein LOC105561015 [Vollenhovia emeryi]